jgi:hypothetical protein
MSDRFTTQKVTVIDRLKSTTDKPTREPAEHPDRVPQERVAHPLTSRKKPGPARRTERPC